MAKKMTTEEKLSANKYNADEHHAHIVLNKDYPDREEVVKLVQVCPAGLYKLGENGTLFFDYLGCLECGTCRIFSKGKIVEEWGYPRSSMGVSFRQG